MCLSSPSSPDSRPQPSLFLQQAEGGRQRGWMGSAQRDPAARMLPPLPGCCPICGTLGLHAGRPGISQC